MSTLQQAILDRFLATLSSQQELTEDQIERLRAALSTGKKPKVDDVVAVFTSPTGTEVA